MDFELTDEQQLIREAVREFAETEVTPVAAELDRDHRFPYELLPKLAEMNLMGMPYPEKEGGAGADYVSYVIAIEEISRACASTGIIVSAHTSTEPGAGTDAAAGAATATLHADGYALNGSKMFITNAPYAEVYIVFAKTDPERGARGMSAFIVEKDTPGFSVGEAERKLGIRGSSTPPVYFNDCCVPQEALLGSGGDGFKIAMQTLDGGRIGVSAQALGIAQAALDASIAYAKERVQFGKPIASLQAIQWMIADMAMEVDAARLLVYRAASCVDNGRSYSTEGAMAKLFASETASRVAGKAIQIHGGYGYTESYPVERNYRDAKITELYEGTSEVQRMVIARSALR
jgi:butyryl-CoA dehydrogenase